MLQLAVIYYKSSIPGGLGLGTHVAVAAIDSSQYFVFCDYGGSNCHAQNLACFGSCQIVFLPPINDETKTAQDIENAYSLLYKDTDSAMRIYSLLTNNCAHSVSNILSIFFPEFYSAVYWNHDDIGYRAVPKQTFSLFKPWTWIKCILRPCAVKRQAIKLTTNIQPQKECLLQNKLIECLTDTTMAKERIKKDLLRILNLLNRPDVTTPICERIKRGDVVNEDELPRITHCFSRGVVQGALTLGILRKSKNPNLLRKIAHSFYGLFVKTPPHTEIIQSNRDKILQAQETSYSIMSTIIGLPQQTNPHQESSAEIMREFRCSTIPWLPNHHDFQPIQNRQKRQDDTDDPYDKPIACDPDGVIFTS